MNDIKQNINKNNVYVFIDVSNLWEAQKVKGRLFDFQKLKHFLKDKHNAENIKIFYYTAYPANGTRDYDLSGKHKFFTYLKKGLGFTVVKKELKRIRLNTEAGEVIQEKGNMDVEMTINAIHYKDHYSTAILFSGDSDFLALVTYLKNLKKKVYVYSSKNNISEEMRTGADGYTDVLLIKDDVWGSSLKHRGQKQ